MNIVATANIILTLLPVISDTVKNVEAAVGSGNGAQKLQLAIGIIKPIYNASNPPVPFDSLVAHVTEVIAALVTFYNSVRAFSKSTQQAVAA
jgi:hypothetical protein